MRARLVVVMVCVQGERLEVEQSEYKLTLDTIATQLLHNHLTITGINMP